MDNQESLQDKNQILLSQATELYYESKIGESMDILKQIQEVDLKNSQKAIYNRFLLLNLIAQGNLRKARDLRNKILEQYYDESFNYKNEDMSERYGIEDIVLFICILSNHSKFLCNVFLRETAESIFLNIKDIKCQSQLNLVEHTLFRISSILIDTFETQQEEEGSLPDLALESFSGRLLEDILDYLACSQMVNNPYQQKSYSEVFEKCAIKLQEINPLHPLACYNLAVYYLYTDYDKAFNYFKQMFKNNNKNPVCNSFFLKFLLKYQKSYEFEQFYQEMLHLNPNNYRVALARAEFLISQNSQSEAIQIVEESLKKNSNKKEIILNDYNYFHFQTALFFTLEQKEQIYESAIKYGYDDYDFYKRLMSFYIESCNDEKLLQISYQFIKQQQERQEQIEDYVYLKMEEIYIFNGNLKKFILLQLKYKQSNQNYNFLLFEFQENDLDELFKEYSNDLINIITEKVQQFKRENNQDSAVLIGYNSNQKMLYQTYFQFRIETYNLILRQIAFDKSFKEISLFKKSFLFSDFFF